MPTTLTIPKLQMSTTEGTLTEWLVEDGATVTAGQAIYALETDKSVQEIEAPESGRQNQSVILPLPQAEACLPRRAGSGPR